MQPQTRRTVLAATAVGTGSLLLAACGGASSSATAGSTGSGGSSGSSGSGSSPAATRAPVKGIVALADVPVGGSVIVSGQGGGVVVAQPTAGNVVAFSARCTHMGCTVGSRGAQLLCPCHGSMFDASTGKVLRGPAQHPLPSVAVKVEGGQVVQG